MHDPGGEMSRPISAQRIHRGDVLSGADERDDARSSGSKGRAREVARRAGRGGVPERGRRARFLAIPGALLR